MASKRILIIEDDADVRRGLGVWLQASDYGVDFASDGPSGILQAKDKRPDLIILDLGLPGDDGYAVLKELGQASQLASIPVLVLSAWNRYAHEERVRRAGAKIFCQKPVDDDELLARIQQLLTTSGGQDHREVGVSRPRVPVQKRRKSDGNKDTDRR